MLKAKSEAVMCLIIQTGCLSVSIYPQPFILNLSLLFEVLQMSLFFPPIDPPTPHPPPRPATLLPVSWAMHICIYVSLPAPFPLRFVSLFHAPTPSLN